MPRFEYKIIPAPEKANKIRGLKGPARFAATIEQVMNEMGAEGWQFLRVDTLPQEERSGLTSKTITARNLLVFCRELPDIVEENEPAPVEDISAAEEPEPGSDDASLENVFQIETDPEPSEKDAPNR